MGTIGRCFQFSCWMKAYNFACFYFDSTLAYFSHPVPYSLPRIFWKTTAFGSQLGSISLIVFTEQTKLFFTPSKIDFE